MRQSQKEIVVWIPRSMEEYARSLLERGWTETVNEDLEKMNGGKLGRPFVFTRKMIEWGKRLKHALGISYHLVRGFLNHFLEEKGYNRRWKAECTFSDDKRLFGDTLSSRKLETDVEETVMKVLLLNEYKQIRMRCQRSR